MIFGGQVICNVYTYYCLYAFMSFFTQALTILPMIVLHKRTYEQEVLQESSMLNDNGESFVDVHDDK